MTIPEIFALLPSRYIKGKVDKSYTYYFSIGDNDKYTVTISPDNIEVKQGKSENADCVLKAHPDVFTKLVLKGEAPGAFDIARGRFKASNLDVLVKLKDVFRYKD